LHSQKLLEFSLVGDVQWIRAALFNEYLTLLTSSGNVSHELLLALFFLSLLPLEVAFIMQANQFCLLTLFQNGFPLRSQL
jgi:hypothetical protein